MREGSGMLTFEVVVGSQDAGLREGVIGTQLQRSPKALGPCGLLLRAQACGYGIFL